MSFSDNFNRSDSSLSVSPNWTTYDYDGNTVTAGNNDDFKFVNNKLVGGSHQLHAIARVNPSAETFADDQEATVYISDIVSSRAANGGRGGTNISRFNIVGVAVRVQDTGACYAAFIDAFSNEGLGGLLYIRFDENGDKEYYAIEPDYFPDSNTDPDHWSNAIGGDWTDTDAPNKLTLRVHGNVLTVLVNDVIQVIADMSQDKYSDISNDLLTDGQPGIYHEGYGHQGNMPLAHDFGMDNFSAVSHPAFIDDFSRDSNLSQSIETSSHWTSPLPGIMVENGAIDATKIENTGDTVNFIDIYAVSCIEPLNGANQKATLTNYTLEPYEENRISNVFPGVRIDSTTGAGYYMTCANDSGASTNLDISIIHYGGQAGATVPNSGNNTILAYQTLNDTGILPGDVVDLSIKADGDILTASVNGVDLLQATIGGNPYSTGAAYPSTNPRIDSGRPGIYGFNNETDPNPPPAIYFDEFVAYVYYDESTEDPGLPIQVYLRMVGDDNASNQELDIFNFAHSYIATDYTPSDPENDPPAMSMYDPYYSNGRYNYSVNDDYGTDFANTIFSGNGSHFNITVNKTIPPIMVKDNYYTVPGITYSDDTAWRSYMRAKLIVLPEGLSNHSNSLWVNNNINPKLSYRVLSSSGEVLNSNLTGHTQSPTSYALGYSAGGVPATKARTIDLNLSFLATNGEKYHPLKLPGADISVLRNDFSTQTFKDISNVIQINGGIKTANDEISCILEYPTGPNYVILEYTLTVNFYNTVTTEAVEQDFVFTQRVYAWPEQEVQSLQTINTPGTGDPDNLPDLPGGD